MAEYLLQRNAPTGTGSRRAPATVGRVCRDGDALGGRIEEVRDKSQRNRAETAIRAHDWLNQPPRQRRRTATTGSGVAVTRSGRKTLVRARGVLAALGRRWSARRSGGDATRPAKHCALFADGLAADQPSISAG